MLIYKLVARSASEHRERILNYLFRKLYEFTTEIWIFYFETSHGTVTRDYFAGSIYVNTQTTPLMASMSALSSDLRWEIV